MKKIYLVGIVTLFLLTSFISANVLYGAKSSCDNVNVGTIKGDDASSTNDAVQKWESALNKHGLLGKTWIGKLQSNGPNDNNYRVDTGRNTIVFVPCTTDLTKPVELMYFFHGVNGFDVDMEQRLAPQSKQMSGLGRNFILVFPELPWSRGTKEDGRKNQMVIWDGKDSDAKQFHNDVLNLIKTNFANNLNVGFISMTGHSAGGSPLKHMAMRPTPTDSGMNYIKPKKITLSDADYGWTLGQPDYGKNSVTQTIYDYYVKNNPSVELNMLVQDVKNSGAHAPTENSINFVKSIGGQTVSDWSWENKITSGASVGQTFKVPGNFNINYVPFQDGHVTIGTKSLAWVSSGTTVNPLAQQQPIQATQPNYPATYQQSSAVAGQYPQRQKEIDESWLKISSFVGGLLANLVWDINSNSPKPFSVVYPPIQAVQPTQQSSSPNYPITSGKTQAMTGAVPYTYNAQSLTIPPGLEACVAEVEKLAKAAYEMTSWNSCTQGTVPDVCNPSSPNTCCYMKQSGCCYGIPTDKVNNIRGSCTDNCCGSYVWQVFNVAINKYGLKVDWPLKIAPTTKKGYTQAFERDPGDILSEYYLLSLNQWKTPMMPFDGGNFHPGQVIPGDIIYFKFPQNHKGKCPTEGSSHINIVGPPTEDGKSYYIIDIACKNSGFCKTSTWRYPGFFYKKTYCGDQGGEPLLAGEAWQYVYRVIPECIQATQNQMKGFATYNKGNVIT